MRDSMVFYEYMYEASKGLNDEDFRSFISAIFEYGFYGIEPEEGCGIGSVFFPMAKGQIDKGNRNWDSYRGRKTPEYKKWREDVFRRDGYKCKICGVKGGVLNAHHIKPYSKFPNLRYSIDNGVTLCKKCHKEMHNGK